MLHCDILVKVIFVDTLLLEDSLAVFYQAYNYLSLVQVHENVVYQILLEMNLVMVDLCDWQVWYLFCQIFPCFLNDWIVSFACSRLYQTIQKEMDFSFFGVSSILLVKNHESPNLIQQDNEVLLQYLSVISLVKMMTSWAVAASDSTLDDLIWVSVDFQDANDVLVVNDCRDLDVAVIEDIVDMLCFDYLEVCEDQIAILPSLANVLSV